MFLPPQRFLKITAACVLASGFFSQSVKAQSLNLNSKTREATAYQGVAMVSRVVQVPVLPVGSHELRISDLPLSLNPQSLSITGQGQGRLLIQHVQLMTPDERPDAPEVVQLEKSVEQLQIQLAQTDNILQVNQTHQRLLNQLHEYVENHESKEGELDMRAWEKLVAFSLEHQTQVLNVEDLEGLKRKRLQEALSRLQRQLRRLKQTRQATQEARIAVLVEKPGAAQLRLSYLIRGVNWQPAYEGLYDSSKALLNLNYLSDFTQASGEDWHGVKLNLSTATPLLNQPMPEPLRWNIRNRNQAPKSSPVVQQRRNEAYAPAPEPLADADLSLEDRPVNFVRTEVQNTGISVVFGLPQRQNIPSSLKTRRISMARKELPAKTEYKIIPRQIQRAFLELKVKNNSGLPLLPGQIRTYVDGDFTGAQNMKLVRSGEEVPLNFGVEQDIRVTWKEISRKVVANDVLGNRETLRVTYRAEFTNFKNKSVRLRVLEPLPQVSVPEIKVKLHQTNPRPDKVQDDKLLTWYFTPQPQEKKQLEISYDINYPKGNPPLF